MAIPSKIDGELNIKYTYSVNFMENNQVKWASRWDYILDSMPHTDIQVLTILLTILYFIIIVLFIVVCYYELFGHSTFPFGNGCDDYHQIST